jgi:hypothetical protein
MFTWLPSYRHLVRAEASELMLRHEIVAYSIARKAMRTARRRGDARSEKVFAKVAIEIAGRTGREVGVDTATRYLY